MFKLTLYVSVRLPVNSRLASIGNFLRGQKLYMEFWLLGGSALNAHIVQVQIYLHYEILWGCFKKCIIICIVCAY